MAVPEPLVWLAFVAAVTTRIRLATGILILPEQHPLVVAKQVATLDRLCAGRLSLGVGAGWLREEFDAVGAVFDGRGARLDEAIGVMRRAWADHIVVSGSCRARPRHRLPADNVRHALVRRTRPRVGIVESRGRP